MRRAPEIPSVEFECSAVEKTATGVRLTLVEEKRQIEVPFDAIDYVAPVRKDGRVFVLVFRKDLAAPALDARISDAEKVIAADEKREEKPLEKPLEFEEVKPAEPPKEEEPPKGDVRGR